VRDSLISKTGEEMTMYLYEAISKVLKDNRNVPLTIEEIADAINRQGLYVKKDGSKADIYGVGLRAVSDVAKSRTPLFDVLIRLRK
jgi:hypothetical protein